MPVPIIQTPTTSVIKPSNLVEVSVERLNYLLFLEKNISTVIKVAVNINKLTVS